jgi:hypothetical protein
VAAGLQYVADGVQVAAMDAGGRHDLDPRLLPEDVVGGWIVRRQCS